MPVSHALRAGVRPLRLVQRALAMPSGSWQDLAVAQLALVRAQWIVWVRPVGRLVTENATLPDHSLRGVRDADRTRAARLARAVSRAARYGLFRPKCLVRSLALLHLLQRHRIADARIRVGVRRADGTMHAHAWVERHGYVLGDDPAYVTGFAPLFDVAQAAAAGPMFREMGR